MWDVMLLNHGGNLQTLFWQHDTPTPIEIQHRDTRMMGYILSPDIWIWISADTDTDN